MKTFLCVYLGSAFGAVTLTPVLIWLAHQVNAVDHPTVRAVHKRPIPRIGGVAIFLPTVCSIALAVLLDNRIGREFREIQVPLTTLLCLATFVFLVGLVDDLKGLSARFKFGSELLAAVVLCLAGARVSQIRLTDGLTLDLGWWGCLLTLLWVVGITNAVNLSDGLDGLAAGISAVACGVIAIFAIHDGNVVVGVFMLALIGSLCGFLVFNFYPAKVFMGDCGSLFLGFTIAAASVICVVKSTAFVGLALPLLALGIPIFDTLLSMLRRFLERRSLFSPDCSHFHHRLLDLGLRQRHVVVTIYLATLLAAGLGLFMMVRQDIGSLIVFASILLLILLLFRVVGAVRLRETLVRLQKKRVLTRCQKQERSAFENLQLQFRQVRDSDQWWSAVCEAAQQMDFAWVSLKTSHEDGRINTTVWLVPSVKRNLSRIVTMTLPFRVAQNSMSQEFEIAIWANGSLESAGRRALLFGRLIEEYDVPASLSQGPQAQQAETSASRL